MANSIQRGGLEFGPFRLDPGKRILWRGSEIIPLPPKAIDLLAVLAEQAGELVNKDELLERVWPETFVEEANLSVNVSILRKALGRQADGSPYIETLARRGYRFVAAVQAAQTPGATSPPCLAVLPFTWLGSGEDEYLGVGMADALITRLARLRRIEVRPTSAVLRLAGSDPASAARSLRVDAVVEGRLQQHGERLRVTVQLVPAIDSIEPWADRFDTAAGDLFDVQDALAERIAAGLVATLEVDERQRLGKRHTQNLNAYQTYARGRYFWSRLSGPWIEKAMESFQEATELDAGYALPHAGLADAYAVLGFSGFVTPRDAWPMAATEAEKALALDDTVAEAHVCLAFVNLFQRWDWSAAAQGLERAVALDPNSAMVYQWQALFLDMTGEFAQATQAILRAQELDPLSAIISTLVAFQYHLQGRYDLELEQCQRTLELEPDQFLAHWSLGLAYEHQERLEQAAEEHRRAVQLSQELPMLKAVYARTLALANREDEARKLLDELSARAQESYASAYQLATIHLALREQEAALDCLERACTQRDPWAVWLKVDPMLAPLRGEPRFKVLVKQVAGG